MKKYTLIQLLKDAGVGWKGFFIPTVLSLLAGFSEAINVAVLLPLCRGLVVGSYDFYKSKSVFLHLGEWLLLDHLSNTFIFCILLGVVFLSATSKCIFEYFSLLLISKKIRVFTNNMRKILFGRYIGFGKLYFDQSNLGSIHQNLIVATARLSWDFSSYQLALTMLIQLIVYIVAMFIISWQLTLVAFIIFPVLHFSSYGLIKKISASSRDFADAADRLSKKVFNVFSSVVLVKSYNAEKIEKASFNKVSDDVCCIENSIDKKNTLIAPLQEFVFLVMMLFLVGTIAVLVRWRMVGDFSSFLVFFYILKRSSNHFRMINHIRASYAVSLGLWQNVLATMDDEGKFFVSEGHKPFRDLKKSIQIKDLTFCYPSRKDVLKSCSFEIEKGKLTAIVGETGSGKSTFVNLLCRFYEPPKGSILIDGIDINEFSLNSFHSQIAYVSQDAQLINDSLRSNLLYGLPEGSISEERLSQVLERSRLSGYVVKLQEGLDTQVKDMGRRKSDSLDTAAGDRGARLSGGEKQRLSIARAMLKNAPILVLDEATSALDSQTERMIQESIAEVAKGRTSIVIAHRLSTIKNADKIIVFSQGQVAESGTLNELLDKRGRFYEFWEAQKF